MNQDGIVEMFFDANHNLLRCYNVLHGNSSLIKEGFVQELIDTCEMIVRESRSKE